MTTRDQQSFSECRFGFGKRLRFFAVLVAVAVVSLLIPATISSKPMSHGSGGVGATPLRSLVESGYADLGLPGISVEVVGRSGVVDSVALGELTADSTVLLGSTSKSITAIALMQAAEGGALSLDDPVSKWLPELNVPDDVTVQDLAHHRSGLTTDSTRGHLRFSDDRQFRYANENYNLLSQVIETATGVPYSHQLAEQVFTPLGLKHSFVVGEGRDSEIVQGHVGVLGNFVPTKLADYGPDSWIQAASGATCSSATDSGTILRMLLNQGELDGTRILSPESVQTILTDTVPTDGSPAVDGPLDPEGGYGFGWIHKNLDGEDVFVHVGKVPTHTTVFALIPDRGIGITLMVNAGDFLVTTPLIEDLADSVIRQILDKPFEPPKPGINTFRQVVLDCSYLGIVALGLAGWFVHSKRAGKAGFFAYHVLLPLILIIAIRQASGTPFIWLWHFAPDASTALGISAANIIASGTWKALRRSE
ncbi:MAG: serine hydrolase domain-containing protein [Scrofimicrobium sp.]